MKHKTKFKSTHGAGSLGNQKTRPYPDKTQVPTRAPKPASTKVKMDRKHK